jgi:Glycosyl transferase family 2
MLAVESPAVAAKPTTAARPSAQAPGGQLGEPLPLRAGFVGERARRLFGGALEAVAISPRDNGRVGGLEILLIDCDHPGLAPAEVDSLARAATAAQVPVVGLRRAPAPRWEGAVDLVVGAAPAGGAGTLPAAPPVDPRAFNPIGFRDADAAGFAALVTGATDVGELDSGLTLIARVAGDEPVALLTQREAGLPPMPSGTRVASLPSAGGLVRAVRPHLGVLDHPGFHRSEWERAGWIVKLAAAGVPVVAAEVSPELAELLGPELAAALAGFDAAELTDPDRRERISVALRRAALRHHSQEARWRQIAAGVGIELPPRPMVSVIFSTRREEWLEHGLAQVNRQSYEPRELVVCLHGDDFDPGIEERVLTLASGTVKIERVDGELTLGDALNQGVAAAAGELVTKMDDDDYYNVDHLWDLVLALEYSGADLVGKGAEFVYLENIDLTIRRFIGDAESDHPRLAGGGMMARKGPLDAVGGWPSRTRGEDTWIVKNFKRSGRRTHRTHGFGYILNRHMRGHTWNTYVDYFLVQSQREWRGLRLDVTAIEPDGRTDRAASG